MSHNFPEPEFPRPFVADRLGTVAITETLSASAGERAALAMRLGLVELRQFSATVVLERGLSGLIHVKGRLEADVVQTCIVTLVAFPSHVEDSFALDFGNGTVMPTDEIDLDPDYDPPEPIEDGVIDIGELATQYLALALDPYPRAPGATLESVWDDSDADALSPFAILKALKTPN
jgi:uncharacterized metal-binding protein YceD (DUF177 family)